MIGAEFDPRAITADWGFPTRMQVGPGRLAELAPLCRELGVTRPLLVTDSGLRAHAMIAASVARLTDAGLQPSVFSDVTGNPAQAQVAAGVQAFCAGRHDSVIAIGGGSALDTGKATAFMVGQQRPIWDFEDRADNWKRADAAAIAPVIAIPTTAGTGSEVGRACVITNRQAERKIIVFHPRMLPVAVILDPEVTVELPPSITAATGMDAFVHCFEAWCAPGFHPLADGLALQGIRLIGQSLPRVYDDGANLEARTQMLAAASMGGLAFQKGLGAVHAIAHPVGAIHHTHHGCTNAVLLPYVMRFNRPAIADRLVPVAQALGLRQATFAAVLDWVLQLREHLGIPHDLAALGVGLDRAEDIGRLAAIDPSAAGNPVPVSARNLARLFSDAVAGRL